MNNLDEILPNSEDVINIIRNKDTPDNMTKKRVYLPDYYRKDRLSSNDIGSEELRPFNMNNDESESSWTDDNVSEQVYKPLETVQDTGYDYNLGEGDGYDDNQDNDNDYD